LTAISELFNDAGLSDVCARWIGFPDRFVEHGPRDILTGVSEINCNEGREPALGEVSGLDLL